MKAFSTKHAHPGRLVAKREETGERGPFDMHDVTGAEGVPTAGVDGFADEAPAPPANARMNCTVQYGT